MWRIKKMRDWPLVRVSGVEGIAMDLSQMRVLLVEASLTQQRIIKARLMELGVQYVTYAQSGQEALLAIRQGSPDLVISNMYLSDMTGTELLHEIRLDTETQATPFILISGERNWHLLDGIRQAGCVAILPKPFELNELKYALTATANFHHKQSLSLSSYCVDDLNVLVVDDSKMARNHMMRVLRSMGVDRLTEAANGVEATQYLSKHYFDLVVTDYNMPEMDGEKLTAYIRENSAQQTIPIIMVTSEESESRLSAVMQSGVSAICDKPFDPNTVRALLEEVLS